MILSSRRSEFLVFDVLRFQHLEKRIAEQVRVFAVIETEAHFIKVGLQMLCADFMPCSDDAALEQRERALYGVRVYVANGVDAILVLDRFVFAEHASLGDSGRVSSELIGHDYVNIMRDVFFYVLRQCAALYVLSMEEAESAATLTDADDNFFFALGMTDLVLMSALLSTDESFIDFDRTAQSRAILSSGHRSADSVAQVPSGFVTLFPEHPINLTGRDALLRFGHQIGNEEPFSQRQVGIVEHGVHCHGKLVMA
jgi:hypothetical protein